MGEWSDLIAYLEENVDGLKAQALLFSLDSITKKIVERKYQMVKKRLVVTTALTAGDHSLLKCRSLIMPNFNIIPFVATKIGTYEPLLLVGSSLNLMLPLVESVISSVTTAGVTKRFLDDMLQDIKHDAVLIYEHIMKTNADHRM